MAEELKPQSPPRSALFPGKSTPSFGNWHWNSVGCVAQLSNTIPSFASDHEIFVIHLMLGILLWNPNEDGNGSEDAKPPEGPLTFAVIF